MEFGALLELQNFSPVRKTFFFFFHLEFSAFCTCPTEQFLVAVEFLGEHGTVVLVD